MFHYGQDAAIRGFINGKLWLAQSVKVVSDTPAESVLLLAPGAQCAYPSGYWRWKKGDVSGGNRWDDVRSMAWTLRRFAWSRKRLLMVLHPGEIYATYVLWDGASDAFLGYYLNFQTPFQRSAIGFNTLDLELDIVIQPDFSWAYKDEALYNEGLREGFIAQQHASAIEDVKSEITAIINEKRYPLDGTWEHWRPDPDWTPSRLPEGWET